MCAVGLLMAAGRNDFAMNLQKIVRRMAPSLSRGTPFLYILRLLSGNFYVGCSTDFEARFREQRTACRPTAHEPATIDNLRLAVGRPERSGGHVGKRRVARVRHFRNYVHGLTAIGV